MSRFLICTQPIIGHVEPGLVIAEALRSRGHEVAWYTGSCVRARIEGKGYRVFPLVRGLDYDGADPNRFFPAREGLTGLADLKFILRHAFAAGMPLQAADLTEIVREFPPDAFVADFVTFGPRVLSERGGPPWAGYGLSALALSSRDTAPYGLSLFPSATPWGRLRNRALSALVQHVLLRDVVADHDDRRQEVGLPRQGIGPMDTPLSPFLFLQGCVPEFEYPRSDLAPQVHFVGALTPAPARGDGHSRPAWWPDLDSGKPVVMVTQGTMDNKDLSELMKPALEGLAREDVIVVATTGRPIVEGELGAIPANARVERFVPYQDLLPHVDVMVSNGGYNGVLIALCNGVPLVVNGAQSDKPEICTRVRWSGAGVRLAGTRARPERVRSAVRQVLGDARFRQRARFLQERFAAYDGPGNSAALLEQLARTKRPVLRSG